VANFTHYHWRVEARRIWVSSIPVYNQIHVIMIYGSSRMNVSVVVKALQHYPGSSCGAVVLGVIRAYATDLSRELPVVIGALLLGYAYHRQRRAGLHPTR
jgi:hypothetical protein